MQVFHVMRRMDEIGCDLFLDIHGDEEIAANFLAGSEVTAWMWFECSGRLVKISPTMTCSRAF